MKWRMCKAIVKNIGHLMSYDFWKAGLLDQDFPAKSLALMILFAACSDILRMIFKPGYPGPETAN